MRDKDCELCNGSGWYGDNGPGISGNREYVPCEHCNSQGEDMTTTENEKKEMRQEERLAFPGTDARGFVSDGMFLRDYFAAKAMQGMMATERSYRVSEDDLSVEAYRMADAMIRAREGV